MDFYKEMFELDEFVLNNFLENDLFNSQMMTWSSEEYYDDTLDEFITEEMEEHYNFDSGFETDYEDEYSETEWTSMK